MTTGKSDLSIVIPVYRGAHLLKENLPLLNNYLSRLSVQSQVLVVDDGSEDPKKCRATASENGALFLANIKNQGKGAAVRKGMLAANGDVRIFTDADLPYKLESIGEAYLLLRNEQFDLVVGDRTLPQSAYFELIPSGRKISSRIFSWIVRAMLLGENYDTQCGFKGFTARSAQATFNKTRIDRFAMDVEALCIAKLQGLSIGRLAVQLRVWQDSDVSILKDGLAMCRDLLRIRYFLGAGAYKST